MSLQQLQKLPLAVVQRFLDIRDAKAVGIGPALAEYILPRTCIKNMLRSRNVPRNCSKNIKNFQYIPVGRGFTMRLTILIVIVT